MMLDYTFTFLPANVDYQQLGLEEGRRVGFQDIYQRQMTRCYKLQNFTLSCEAVQFINAHLEPDPCRRPSMKQLLKYEPWLDLARR